MMIINILKKKKAILCPFYLFILISPSHLFAQKKMLVPKKGEISFGLEVKIIDKAIYRKSIENYKSLMISDLQKMIFKKKDGEEEIAIDSTQINQFLESFNTITFEQLFKQQSKIIYTHTYQDTIILVSFDLAAPDTVISDTVVSDSLYNQDLELMRNMGPNQINIKNSTLTRTAMDSKEPLNTVPFEYAIRGKTQITEFKNERRQIAGYDCYRVVFKFKEDVGQEDPLLFQDVEETRDMWVTEDIRSMFHPFCNDKEVLLKYFPLEIIQSNNLLKGMVTEYKLKSCTLAN